MLEELRKDEEAVRHQESAAASDVSGLRGWARARVLLWDLVERPTTSRAARIVMLFSIFFIALSTVTLTVSTIRDDKPLPPDQPGNTTPQPEVAITNASSTQCTGASHSHTGDDKETPIFREIETVCVGWFTLEYLLRLVSSPNRFKFLRGGMNIIDLMAILPFYLTAFFSPIIQILQGDDGGNGESSRAECSALHYTHDSNELQCTVTYCTCTVLYRVQQVRLVAHNGDGRRHQTRAADPAHSANSARPETRAPLDRPESARHVPTGPDTLPSLIHSQTHSCVQ